MEKEYIERETILNLLKKYGIKRGNKVYGIADIGDVIMAIENIPAADVVEVVRCKDCKYWEKQIDSIQGKCVLGGHYPTGRWYCANGDRRE